MAKTREGGINFLACLPEEDKEWIKAQAKANFSSQNAEIVKCIRLAKRQQLQEQAAS
jgi:hypothetical protein